MKVIEGDLLEITNGVICHQVNCKRVMGSGLAKSIKERYPIVFTSYLKFCNENDVLLGKCQLVPVADNLTVANIFGQFSYGRSKVHTDLSAVRKALRQLKKMCSHEQIYFPYGIGCGLGGESWVNVSKVIEEEIPNAIIVKKI